MSAVVAAAVLDGARMPLHEARLPVTDAGVARGDGAFETVGVWDGAPFLLEEHLARLRRSLDLVGLAAVDPGLLRADVALLLDGVRADAALRLYVTGSGTRLVTLDRLPDRVLPVRLAPQPGSWIAPLPPGSPGAPASPSGAYGGPKTMSYQPNMAASRAARAQGADDAVLVAADGVVLEGPTFALLWVRDGVLHAPDLSLGIIDSISRRTLLALARADGTPVREGRWTLADLVGAEEVLAVSSLRDVVAVRAIAGTVTLDGPTPLRDALAAGLWARRRQTHPHPSATGR